MKAGDTLLLVGATPRRTGRQPLSARNASAARRARRRRSISPPSGATAISCADLILSGRVSAVHDLSDGGLIGAAAEMALAATAA